MQRLQEEEIYTAKEAKRVGVVSKVRRKQNVLYPEIQEKTIFRDELCQMLLRGQVR